MTFRYFTLVSFIIFQLSLLCATYTIEIDEAVISPVYVEIDSTLDGPELIIPAGETSATYTTTGIGPDIEIKDKDLEIAKYTGFNILSQQAVNASSPSELKRLILGLASGKIFINGYNPKGEIVAQGSVVNIDHDLVGYMIKPIPKVSTPNVSYNSQGLSGSVIADLSGNNILPVNGINIQENGSAFVDVVPGSYHPSHFNAIEKNTNCQTIEDLVYGKIHATQKAELPDSIRVLYVTEDGNLVFNYSNHEGNEMFLPDNLLEAYAFIPGEEGKFYAQQIYNKNQVLGSPSDFTAVEKDGIKEFTFYERFENADGFENNEGLYISQVAQAISKMGLSGNSNSTYDNNGNPYKEKLLHPNTTYEQVINLLPIWEGQLRMCFTEDQFNNQYTTPEITEENGVLNIEQPVDNLGKLIYIENETDYVNKWINASLENHANVLEIDNNYTYNSGDVENNKRYRDQARIGTNMSPQGVLQEISSSEAPGINNVNIETIVNNQGGYAGFNSNSDGLLFNLLNNNYGLTAEEMYNLLIISGNDYSFSFFNNSGEIQSKTITALPTSLSYQRN